jgi:ABC-2 type transport system ATP-binding protein
MMNAIEVKNLKKNFGDSWAVKGVDLAVGQGEVLSLLGPNGAGKSTIISMLSGLLEPAEGDAWIMGHSVRTEALASKEALGVVPQEIALYPDLSARENLDFWGRMYGLRGKELKARVQEVLEIIGLENRQKDRVGTYSGGMKRRVNIGAALLHKPAVIIMDEPTVGIDPQSRRHILDNVKELNQQGMTVLYTTHYMEEAEELSDRIAIIDQGEIIAQGTYKELIQLVGEQTRLDLSINVADDRIIPIWRKLAGVNQVDRVDGVISILVDDSNMALPRLFEAANQQHVRITSVAIQEPNLEAVFLHLTGRALRD